MSDLNQRQFVEYTDLADRLLDSTHRPVDFVKWLQQQTE